MRYIAKCGSSTVDPWKIFQWRAQWHMVVPGYRALMAWRSRSRCRIETTSYWRNFELRRNLPHRSHPPSPCRRLRHSQLCRTEQQTTTNFQLELRLDTHCTKDSFSLGVPRRLRQDAINITQHGRTHTAVRLNAACCHRAHYKMTSSRKLEVHNVSQRR